MKTNPMPVPVMPAKGEPVSSDTLVEYIRASVSYHSADAVTPDPLRSFELLLRIMIERSQRLPEDAVDQANVL